MDGSFRLCFDGLHSSKHQIPMAQLGKSLTGADRIIGAGLVLFATKRMPKKREHAGLIISVEAPKQGSVEINAILAHVPWVLPILQDFIVAGGVEFACNFLSYVLAKFGGRKSESEMFLQALLQMNRDSLQSRDQNDQEWRQFTLMLVDKLKPAAKQAVSPLGDGASTLSIKGPTRDFVVVDEPMAEAIRSSEEVVVGDVSVFRGKILGVDKQTGSCRFEIDGEDKSIRGKITDPVLANPGNIYTHALDAAISVEITGKPTLREGEIKTLYISDAKEVVP